MANRNQRVWQLVACVIVVAACTGGRTSADQGATAISNDPPVEVELQFSVVTLTRGNRAWEESVRLYDFESCVVTLNQEAQLELTGSRGPGKSVVARASLKLIAWKHLDGGLAMKGALSMHGTAPLRVRIEGRIEEGSDPRVVGLLPMGRDGYVKAQATFQTLTRKATSFALPDLNGSQVTLEQLKGQWVLLSFWASWNESGKCVGRICEKLAAAPRLTKLVISSYEDGPDEIETARIRAATLGFRFTAQVLFDRSASVAKAYAVHDLPTFILIDPAGWVRRVWTGSKSDEIASQVLAMVGSSDETQRQRNLTWLRGSQ